jgi:hypothetical protein
VQVRGFADRNLRNPNDPTAATNRRISVTVKYLTPPDDEKEEPAKEHSAAPAEPPKEAEHH